MAAAPAAHLCKVAPSRQQLVVVGHAQEEGEVVGDVASVRVHQKVPAAGGEKSRVVRHKVPPSAARPGTSLPARRRLPTAAAVRAGVLCTAHALVKARSSIACWWCGCRRCRCRRQEPRPLEAASHGAAPGLHLLSLRWPRPPRKAGTAVPVRLRPGRQRQAPTT